MTQALTRWTANLSPAKRAILWHSSLIATIFSIGFVIGVVASSIDKGRLPPSAMTYLALVVAVTALMGGILFIIALRRVEPPRTAYERRYNRVILACAGIGGAIGLIWAVTQLARADEPEHLTLEWLLDTAAYQSLSPAVAIGVVLALLIVFGGTFTWYHRIIDDHEERGVLWGSTIAYYFMLFAVPCWLLLAAGGLLPALTGAIALALVVFSTFVQAAVWAWLKYR